MMFICMTYSLDSDTSTKISLEKENYEVNGTPIAALYYKLILSKAEVDTLATVVIAKQELSQLDKRMITCNNDIESFNTSVNELKLKLAQRGTTIDSTDLLINLFNGYKAAQDSDFQITIDKLYRDYMHGEAPNLTTESLMQRAFTAYQVRKEAKVWGSLSPDQQQIVALQAKVDELKDTRLKVDTSSKKKKRKEKEKEGGKM